MATIRVDELMATFSAGLGTSAVVDSLYHALEEEYSLLREKSWVWNWVMVDLLTKAAVAEPQPATFSWVEGQTYVTCTQNLSLGFLMTGRVVMLGDEWYRVLDYGLFNSARFYVDREILGSSTGNVLYFSRNTYCLRTTVVDYIRLDGKRKLSRLSPTFLSIRFCGNVHPNLGNPTSYVDEDNTHREIPAPGYAPVVSSAGSGVLANGTYTYFYTRYDPETGLESDPGPSQTYVNTTGFAASVVYGNPAADRSESTSYYLRLYRSLENRSTPRQRPPMWLVQERTAATAGSPHIDPISDVVLVTATRYYDGAKTLIRLWPPPDATRHSLNTRHVNCWGRRPYEKDYLNLGRNDEVLELLRIFLKGVLDLQGGDAQSQRTASVIFRQQLKYLLNESRPAADGDQGPETHFPPVAGPSIIDGGDWVEALNWKE